MSAEATGKQIAEFLQRGEETGCIELSALDELVGELQLSGDELDALHEEIHSRGIELSDDCGRAETAPTSYRQDELATVTTDALQLFLNEIRRHPLLTKEEEVELAKQVEAGDLAAKERMVNSNLRLVVANARRYENLGLPLLDLIQEGTLGLIRAVEKFDWHRGLKFSTYATYWIRQAMTRALDAKSRTIKISIDVLQRERKIARAERELWTRLGRQPTIEEVAEAAELEPEEVEAVREAPRTVTSLERRVGEEEGTELGSLLPAPGPGPAEEAVVSLSEQALRDAIAELPEPERDVVRLRYGINGDQPTTMTDVAKRLGIPTTSVKTLEQKGLARLAERRELQPLGELG